MFTLRVANLQDCSMSGNAGEICEEVADMAKDQHKAELYSPPVGGGPCVPVPLWRGGTICCCCCAAAEPLCAGAALGALHTALSCSVSPLSKRIPSRT